MAHPNQSEVEILFSMDKRETYMQFLLLQRLSRVSLELRVESFINKWMDGSYNFIVTAS